MSSEARYSKVYRRKWNDAKFCQLSKPQPNGQSLWDRLTTGPENTNIPGLFQAWDTGLAKAMGWTLEGFREAFREVSQQGMAKADWDSGLVFLPNAIKHNRPTSPNVIKSWAATWDELPECELKLEAYQHLKAFTEGMSKAFREAFSEAIPKPCWKPSGMPSRNQEQEQEQEQEKDLDLGGGNQDLTGHSPPADPDPPPPELAKGPDGDQETPCPADLLERPEVTAALAADAAEFGAELADVQAKAQEFLGYWTIGPGMGKRRRHWPWKLRKELKEAHRLGTLGKPKASEPRVRAAPAHPDAERIERNRAVEAQREVDLILGRGSAR